MSNYNFQSYVSFLTGLGKSAKQITDSIKKHAKYKFVGTSVIKNTIRVVNNINRAAQRLSKGDSAKKLSSFLNKDSGKGDNTIHVSLKFVFDFPNGSTSGKTGKQTVALDVDVDAGLTKKQLLKILRQIVDDWIIANYGTSGLDRKKSSISVISIQGV